MIYAFLETLNADSCQCGPNCVCGDACRCKTKACAHNCACGL